MIRKQESRHAFAAVNILKEVRSRCERYGCHKARRTERQHSKTANQQLAAGVGQGRNVHHLRLQHVAVEVGFGGVEPFGGVRLEITGSAHGLARYRIAGKQ